MEKRWKLGRRCCRHLTSPDGSHFDGSVANNEFSPPKKENRRDTGPEQVPPVTALDLFVLGVRQMFLWTFFGACPRRCPRSSLIRLRMASKGTTVSSGRRLCSATWLVFTALLIGRRWVFSYPLSDCRLATPPRQIKLRLPLILRLSRATVTFPPEILSVSTRPLDVRWNNLTGSYRVNATGPTGGT